MQKLVLMIYEESTVFGCMKRAMCFYWSAVANPDLKMVQILLKLLDELHVVTIKLDLNSNIVRKHSLQYITNQIPFS